MAEIVWTYQGPSLTMEEIEAFECVHNVRLHPDHKWFLINIVNGGFPSPAYVVPTMNCPGGAAFFHGVYGINHQEEIYDLARDLERHRPMLSHYIPFGWDDVGGELFISMRRNPGSVTYNPRDPDGMYHSADTLQSFLANLQPLDALPDEDF